jgi:predicted GIY-YIG superfamily endonuclease
MTNESLKNNIDLLERNLKSKFKWVFECDPSDKNSVYLVLFNCGKYYIGQTSSSLSHRMSQHKDAANKNRTTNKFHKRLNYAIKNGEVVRVKVIQKLKCEIERKSKEEMQISVSKFKYSNLCLNTKNS